MFAGIIMRAAAGHPREYATAETLIRALTPYQQADKTGAWENDKAIIVQALTWNTATSKHETTPYQCPHSQLVISSWVRLDNRAELCVALKS